MRLPRDLTGDQLARLLARHYGYRVTRTKGSHMRVKLDLADGGQHSVTVPRHGDIRVGTLDTIITDVAKFVGETKGEVRRTPFG